MATPFVLVPGRVHSISNCCGGRVEAVQGRRLALRRYRLAHFILSERREVIGSRLIETCDLVLKSTAKRWHKARHKNTRFQSRRSACIKSATRYGTGLRPPLPKFASASSKSRVRAYTLRHLAIKESAIRVHNVRYCPSEDSSQATRLSSNLPVVCTFQASSSLDWAGPIP